MSLPIKQRKKGKNAFGATSPPFIDYLKEILRRYPDGGQILKELIQNADDGGASEVVFIHDERSYGRHSVQTEALGKYQGPALYAFNNAAFSEEDWEGIQKAGRSIKQNDPTKVGRFGIGFNSVYHVTDLPCVFSSKHLAVFDPQKMVFDEEREGYRWSLDDEEDRKHFAKYTDQFKHFQDILKLIFSCTWDEIFSAKYFNGTLFRFPLRNEPSEISDNLYNAKKVAELFDSFIADVDISLLFLRSVSSISLIHIDPNGSVSVRMKASVSSPSSPLQECGMLDFQEKYVEGTTNFKIVSCNSPDMEETKTKWLVTACNLKEGWVPEIDTLAVKMSFRPQVDVAFQCDQNGTHVTGGLSCFLPLPKNEANKTGLPVHINACFGLTDNRRYIKWQEVDQKNDESAIWNELLVKKVLPHVYLMMIQDAVQLSRKSILPASTVYNLWPDLNKTEHRDRWHKVAVDVLKQVLQGKEVFSLAENETSWVGISDAVFPNSTADTHMSAVAKLLIAEGENLVSVLEHVSKAIEMTFPEPATLNWVTPSFVRTVLCKSEIGSLCKDDKLSLLEYVLSDEKYEELHGLQLLPLSDGSFRSFTSEEDPALIDSEEFPRVLLPFCKDRFLPDDLNSNTIHHMRQMAMKNLYTLITLDAKNVATFAKKHLPRDWNEGQGHVKWNSVKNDQPPKTWLTEFWKFLNTHWEELNEFIGMPLIPLEPLQKTGNCTLLARLEKNSTLIFQSSRESSLSDQIQKVVHLVGGTVITKDECLRHHDIENYVLITSPKNVLQVLLNCDREKVISGITSASLHEKEELKTYLSCLERLSEAERSLLSALPIFQLMSGKYVAVQSKQAVILKSNPAVPHDLPVPESTVKCANEADRRLLILLKVDLLDAAQLAIQLVDCIERIFFNNEDEQKIMTWILTNGNILFSQNGELLRKSKNLSFIKTEQGERKQPSSVFDPTNKVFQDLFEEDFFPPAVYRTQLLLESLKYLGLQIKEEQISSENLLHVASQIQKLHVHSRNKAFKKADVLVKVLNRNDLLSNFSDKERRALIQMQWVPCENPNAANSKGNQKRGLYKPAEIRVSKYAPIVGHVMPLTTELSESVCEKLDLHMPPPADKVIENMCVLGSMAQILDNPDSDYDFKNKLHSTYKFMQENIEYFRGEINKKCIAWLWCHNEFVSPRDVVLSYPAELDLSLYIKKVPHEFLPYAKLLEEFGVKESLLHEELEDIFHDIKQSIEDRDPPYGEPSELKVSISILDWMRKNEKPLSVNTPVPVRAPNNNFTLQPLKNTVFCDISDEGLDDLMQDQEEFHVIHEEVLSVTAKWLKIPFLSTRILKPQFIRDEEDCAGIEQCGQVEPITLRIKNILKEYDEESDVFKELIQNAEDAGASTCGFLLDFRTHLPESLIDDGMALCNGPCLWAFNNKLFSDEDWKNIVRVGSGSKANKVEKIGHFGLGFNAVYHITDIPSILSGKNLLILDPNVTHLEKHIHSKANPGIKLDLFRKRLFRRFPGQFRSYQGIFDCDLSKENNTYYNGTLIKLPFRTPEEAFTSEICSKVYDKDRINGFQKHFSVDSQTPLLFLKNINSVPLQIISEGAFTPPLPEQIQTLFKITRKVACSINISNAVHLQDIRDTLENLDKSYHKIVDCFTAYIAEIIHEHVGTSSVQYWLLYTCIGTKDSMRMFQRELQECKFSLPVGGVAVPLQREAQNEWSPDESCAVGQAFCFLPLPIETGLPVHINGSFAVTSNRKALWKSGTKMEWNKALLQDATATAYITTLLELKNMAQNGNLRNYAYYTFWPDIERVGKEFQPLVHAVYSAIAQNKSGRSPNLFSNGQTWCSIDEARFLDPNIEENKAVGDLALKVFLNYTESSYCAVPLPSWVRRSLIRCGFSEVVKDKTFHWAEFYQVVFKNLNNMDAHSRNSLILNAIDLNDQAVDELLKSYPCIPTQKVGKLQFISKLVNPHGKVACLYEAEEGRFLDESQNDYFTPKRIQRLLGLGMLSDTLTLEEVIERAKTIYRVWKMDKMKAQRHVQCLLDCMRGCSHVIDSPYWETLAHVSFLPAQIIDQDNNAMSVLKKPSEVYSYRFYNLVNMIEFTIDHSNLHIQQDDPLFTKIGVKKNPAVETVLKQMKQVYDHSEALEKSVLLNIAKSCYDYLNEYLTKGGDPSDIIKHAQSIPFIFVEDCFVHVHSVAKSKEFEGKPYLYVLPSIFSKFEKLWNSVGIKKQFTINQFTAVLEQMSTVHGPLSASDVHICLSIITKGLYESKEGKVKDCLLPDERGVLTYASRLHFNDSPWMPTQAGMKFCHKLISRSIACYFGVTTTRHHTLKNHQVADFSPFAKEFGQQEKLTVRIKNIIEAYPSKKDILKELIQNADDAGATEIHFVWDKRVHHNQRIFGQKWKLLQGPALCVFNNRKFSDEDLQGIQHLGEGGKHGTLGRTGKYGIGFNSVYQLTDCPSVLTGDENLCIFDPNLKYVQGSTKDSPGCMYSMSKTFKESFMDVYNTFLPDKFTLNTGTMFRFPLRTEEMAKKSEISLNVVREYDMRELFQTLTEDPDGLILFLKHITKIQFQVININGSELNLFLVEKSISENTIQERERFCNDVQKCLKSGNVIPCQTMYNVNISSGKKHSHWVVAERYGSFIRSHEKGDGRSNLKTPQVALAACLGTKPAEIEFQGRAFCSLPLPVKTGLPVHVNGNFEVDFSRRDLWKEDADSLKTNWNQSLKLNSIAPLYADLLTHQCAAFKKDRPISLNLLSSHVHFRYSYFPSVSQHVSPDWHEMISEVYRSINNRNLPVIPVLRSEAMDHLHPSGPKYRVNLSSVSKPDSTDSPHFMTDDLNDLLQVLERTGMNLVPYSWKMEEVRKSFKTAGVEVAEVSPLSVIRYLKKTPLNDPSQTTDDLPLPISQTLVKDAKSCSKILTFCLKTNSKTSTSVDLNGLPLLLTQDQMLRKFNSGSPKLLSEFSKMFHGYEAVFAECSVYIDHIEILQQGKYIGKLSIPQAAKMLKPILQQLLHKSLYNETNGLYTPDTNMIKWLKTLWEFFGDQLKKKETSQSFSEVKTHFLDSPILPVICPSQKNTYFLQTIRNLQSVVHKPDEYISSTLIKLGFMSIDCKFFLGLQQFLLDCVVPELINIRDTTSVLKQLCHVRDSQFEVLSSTETDELQRYLQSGISSFKNNDEYKQMLKSLPLFETISGKRQRINLHRNVFILKTEFQRRFPELYITDDSNTVFLKNNIVNQTWSQSLNIPILGDLEYCVQFILPSVNNLTETQCLDLVKLILDLRQRSDYKGYKDKIASSLSNVRFIRDIHGSLQMASYYFDEKVDLYKVMLPKEQFVPNVFWKLFKDSSTQAKSLLKELGLKHKVSEKEIIEFAVQIESGARGNTDLQVLKHRSLTLLRTVLNDDKKSKIVQRIATIKFIFPVQIGSSLCDYHKPFAEEREAVAIKGSLLEKDPHHQYLIWTAMPILPSKDYSIEQLDALKCAGAFDSPASEHIMQNLKNICRSECKTEMLIDTRARVFRTSYAYLQSLDFNASELVDHPVVLVENDINLVKASQAVFTLPDAIEFRPYLYDIQGKHMKYAEFLKKVGVKEKASATQLCSVLQEIYSESHDKKTLQPNQKRTVQRAVQQIFCLIKEEPKAQHFLKCALYLPSTDFKLYPSHTLFFNDTVFQAKRLENSLETKLKLLVKLKQCHINNDPYEQQKLLQLMPREICPKFLSQIVSQSLASTSEDHCDYGKECNFSGWFEKQLSSREFLHGLICLVREQSDGTISQIDAADMCQRAFGKIQIVCCSALLTELLFNQEPLEGTKTETQVYVKKQQDGCIFYLKHNNKMTPKVVTEVSMYLTKEINGLLKNILDSTRLLVLGQLLLCENMEDVEGTLQQNGIYNSVNEEERCGGCPSPGSPVPEEWYDSLDMHPLNNFEKGEYVAFKKDESKIEYFFAIVVERVDVMSGTVVQKPSRYKIQIGNDEWTEVSCLDLYQFKREKVIKLHNSQIVCTETDNLPEGVASEERTIPQNLEEAKREIDQVLKECWNMSDEDKWKAIKRLYLRWHPDKNLNNTDLANEAFKYLLNKIEELKRGNTQHNTSSNWNDFTAYYSRWNNEARTHRMGRQRFRQNSRWRYDFWSYYRETPRPDRKEAERWYRQAQCDLAAAHSETGGQGNPEWGLFKVHQAVEKALIATEYRSNGQHPGDLSITGLAQRVSHYGTYLSDLPSAVIQLKALGVDAKKTQYPNYHPSPSIPNEQFKSHDAQRAVDIATSLLGKVGQYITE